MADDGGAAGGDAHAIQVQLNNKMVALNQAMAELLHAFAGASPDDRGNISDEMDAVRYERDACQIRIQDLIAQAPFTRPGPEAEQALLDAIQAVGALVNASAGVNAVIKAADDLVKAYTAKSTQAGAA